MQNSCIVRSLAPAALLGLAVTTTALAGDLNPPPGDIAPTMTSLDRLEPRRCINDLPAAADAVHVISEGGHYFLAADITGKFNAHGILVATTEDVTIDLNGFSLNGVPGSLDGIRIDGGGGGAGGMRAGISTSRSNIRRSSASKISSWGGDGIDVSNCDTLDCASLDIIGCSGHGIVCLETKNVIHRDIAARNCLLDGLRVADIGEGAFGKVYRGFTDCAIDACGGNGITVETDLDNAEISVRSSSSSSCTGDGVSALHVSPGGGGGVPTGAGVVTIKDVTVNANNGTGIRIAFAPNTKINCQCSHLRSAGNGGDGMACLSTNPASPHDGTLWSITDSDFSSNGGDGLRSENPLYIGTTKSGNNALYGGRFSVSDPFVMAAVMDHCATKSNGAGGVRVPIGRFSPTFCQITDEGGPGVTLDMGCLVMTECSVHHCAGDGVAVTGTINAQNSTFRRNSGRGVAGGLGTMTMTNCAMELNEGDGATFTDCTTVTLESCVLNENTGNGVTCSSAGVPIRWCAPECMSHRNTGNGFDLNNCDGGQLIECKTSGNGGRGVFCRPAFTNGTIERCTSSGDQGGIHVAGTGNLIRACSAKNGPLGAFVFAQGNAAGPIIDPASLASSCTPHANVLH
jgi:hypothetical protein